MFKSSLIVAMMLLGGFQVSAQTSNTCSNYCNPEKSKPCGGGCIGLAKSCRTSWTTACSGIRPGGGSGPVFDNPTKVDKPPTGPVTPAKQAPKKK